jgi:hypothetical protein
MISGLALLAATPVAAQEESVSAASVPSTYRAISSRATLAEPALPSLEAARSSRTPYDPITMTASRIQATGTGQRRAHNLLAGGAAVQLSSPAVLFGSRQDSTNNWPVIRQFDFDSLTYADIVNLGQLATINRDTYAGALSSSAVGAEKLAVLFGVSQRVSYRGCQLSGGVDQRRARYLHRRSARPGRDADTPGAYHQLRVRIDAVRSRVGLAPFPWSAVQPGTLVQAAHITEMRTALGQAFTAANQAVPSFTASGLVAGTTRVGVVHVQELRDAVITLETT